MVKFFILLSQLGEIVTKDNEKVILNHDTDQNTVEERVQC